MAQVVELPASQVRSPDFKLQYHKKKNKLLHKKFNMLVIILY
jgi:hypothetical protein